MIRTDKYAIFFYEICLFFKCLTTNTILPLVDSFIDISILERFHENFLNKVMMALLCRTDKVCISYSDTIPDSLMLLCHHISIWHRSHSNSLCRFDDLLRVFIYSRDEFDFFSGKSFITRYRIGQKRCISMSNMGNTIGVVDRCCNEKF